MSNFLAIATVTAVFASRIETLLDRDSLSGFGVTTDHPTGDPDPGVYLKLYRVTPNSSLYNTDTPTRRIDGSVIQRPQLILDLHYLLSFVGESTTFDAERLAGSVLLDLHATPIITSDAIATYIATLDADHVLQDSDLDNQIEQVRLTLVPLNLEEMSRLWGLLNQSFYGLSVAYQASVVFLEQALPTTTALPIADVSVQAFAAAMPRITAIRSSVVNQPIVEIGQDLLIRGSGFIGESTWLQLGEALIEVPREHVRSDRIVLPITPALGLAIGAIAIQVVHRINMGDGSPDAYRKAAESNTAVFAFVPRVTLANPNPMLVDGQIEIHLAVDPLPDPDQSVELLLDEVEGNNRHRTTKAWRIEDANVIFTLGPLPSGSWLVRLRVDGVLSQLRRDGVTGRYDDPRVVVP